MSMPSGALQGQGQHIFTCWTILSGTSHEGRLNQTSSKLDGMESAI